METLCKLYLELANVVPDNCRSARELKLLADRDYFGEQLAVLPQIIADVLVLCEEELTAMQRRFIKDQIMLRLDNPT